MQPLLSMIDPLGYNVESGQNAFGYNHLNGQKID